MEDAPARRLVPSLLAAGMALPFLLALVAHVAGPYPAPVAAGPTRGALAFDQYLVDLGPVPATQDVAAHFDFTNRGSHPVEIVSLEPSCGCLRPRLGKIDETPTTSRRDPTAAAPRPWVEKKVYEPGEEGFFSLRVQTANQSPGQKEYTVKVKYKDPQPRETLVTFRALLPDDQVLVRPIALMFYQIGEGSRATPPREFEVIDKRPEHLNIARVECSRREIEITEVGNEVDEDGVWHGRFVVTVPDKLPPGHSETIIRIYTDDPAENYRVLRIPLYLEGPDPRNRIQQTGGTKSKTRIKLP